MPAQRTRVLGLQLYKSNVLGYLHWGFNFYNSAFSVETVNPYASTDSRSTFPAGDAFIVYPTENGCAPSLRYEVVKEGYQDYRALKLLESFIGRENVVALLEENGVEGYNVYPRSAEWHINFRKEINGLLKKYTR